MAEIDILIAIDAATIVAKTTTPSMDPNNPIQADPNSIFMVTSAADVVSGNGGDELNVKAETGDTIRWREMSLSLDVDDRVMLYAFQDSGGGLIQAPQAIVITITDSVPGNPPLPPSTQTIQDFFWQTTVLKPGTDTYHFSFVITSRTGTVLGYYMWDPFITISS